MGWNVRNLRFTTKSCFLYGAPTCIFWVFVIIVSYFVWVKLPTSPPKYITPVYGKFQSFMTSPQSASSKVSEDVLKSYLDPNLHIICSSNRSIDAIIMIHSKHSYFERREIIRETWGKQAVSNSTKNFKILFILGLSDDGKVQKKVEEEKMKWGDILQSDYQDDYHSLTNKLLYGVGTIVASCPATTYIVKADDDIYLNVGGLGRYLSTVRADDHTLHCHVHDNVPQRDPASRWYVTRAEYDGAFYPYYCGGYFVVMRTEVARRLFVAAHYVPHFWIDDVFLFGIVREAERLGITRLTGRDLLQVHRLTDLHRHISQGSPPRLVYFHLLSRSMMTYLSQYITHGVRVFPEINFEVIREVITNEINEHHEPTLQQKVVYFKYKLQLLTHIRNRKTAALETFTESVINMGTFNDDLLTG